MDVQEKSAYPTDQQMDELLKALEKDDPKEIKTVLRKRSQERQYPTREELAEVLEAHRKGGETGILQFLRKQRKKREQAESPSERKEHEQSTLPPAQTT